MKDIKREKKTALARRNARSIPVAAIPFPRSPPPPPVPIPPPVPLNFDSLIRKGKLFMAPEALRLAVERLVAKHWDETLRGVGRDARGLTHSRIQIKQVFAISNSLLKTRYEAGYKMALSRIETIDSGFSDPEINSIESVQLPVRLGEVLLFHGTPRNNVSKIVQQGFKAAKNKRSSHGKGTYLTLSAQKADQFTDLVGTRTNEGLTMFLVRMALGWTVNSEFGHFNCDTVVAEGGKLFQEFVAKRDNFLLPQLLIEYNRV